MRLTAYQRGFVAGSRRMARFLHQEGLSDTLAALAGEGFTLGREPVPDDPVTDWTSEELRRERDHIAELLEMADHLGAHATENTEAQALANVPAHLREGLTRYLDEHVPTGDFLRYVLENQLSQALAHADLRSRTGIYDVAFYLYNYAPTTAWGSKERVAHWLTPAIPLLSPATLGADLEIAEDGTVLCPGCGGRHPVHSCARDVCIPPQPNMKVKHIVQFVYCGRTRLIPLAIDGQELP